MIENILFVDDETDLQPLIEQKFRKFIRSGQCFFHFAQNGVEALEVMHIHPDINIVVTDINMPKMDGLELLQRINEMNNPKIKVIIVSAYGDMDNIRCAMNNGAFDFLTKPIDLNDLEKTIQKTIEIVSVIREGLSSQEKLIDVNKELDAAKEIQQAILPKMFPPYPQIPYFDIYGKMEAAQQVGGDFFDFFLIEDDKIGFVIGDVSGKGVPSSIFMAVARTLIHSYGIAKFSTSECLRLTNEILCTESVDSMFVTVFYGILNYKTGELKYTNAGHNYPYILKNNGNFIILEVGSSIILGAFDDAKFIENTIKLEPNDSIVLYTDGVNESMNAEHQQLGTDTFEHHLQLLVKRNVPQLITEGIFDLVKLHSQDCPQSDDITVLTLSYLGDN